MQNKTAMFRAALPVFVSFAGLIWMRFYDELSTIGVCDPASFGKILELDRVVDFPNTIIFDNQVSGLMKKPAVANQKNLCQGLLRAELCSGKLKEVDRRPKDI